MVYRLEDKHGRGDCLIHNANFAGDSEAGFETQLHGCTAPGNSYGQIARNDGQPGLQWAILQSVAALEELIKQTKGGKLELTYSWISGCEPDDLTDALA